jgi:hypothetical protein
VDSHEHIYIDLRLALKVTLELSDDFDCEEDLMILWDFYRTAS